MKSIALISVFIFIFASSQPAYASWWKDSPKKSHEDSFNKEAFIDSAKTNRVLRIGLVDCIAYALKNNSEIKVERIQPKLKEADINIQKADFEPTLNFDFDISDNEEPTTNPFLAGANTSLTKDTDINVGIDGRLITGTEYNLQFLTKRHRTNSRYQQINPSYEIEPKITITQPLFGDYGIFINRADIVIARNDKEKSEEDFKDKVMDIITETKSDYYGYLYHLEHYSITRSSLERAEELLEINQARYAKGLVSSVDLLETETAVAQREKALLSAESDLKKAEDELKLITGLVDDPEIWNAQLELVDRPEFNVQEVDLIKSLENAFIHRPDYQSKKIDLKNRDIRVKVATNDIFPTIDLTGSFGLNGLGEDYEDAVRKTSSDYKDWTFGVTFSLPWGGGERAEYNQRKLEKMQALIEFKRLEQDIILEVRDKAREADIQYRQVHAAGVSKEKESKNYEAQKERYAAGQVSTHDILDYQDKLSQAELDYIKALIDYNTAIINLEKAEGLTLARNDIILED